MINEATGLAPFGYKDFDMVCIAANKDNGCFFMRGDNKYGITDYNLSLIHIWFRPSTGLLVASLT